MFPILQTEKQTDFSSDSLYRKIFELRTESSLQFAIEWQGKNFGITTPEEIIGLNVVKITSLQVLPSLTLTLSLTCIPLLNAGCYPFVYILFVRVVVVLVILTCRFYDHWYEPK